MTAEIKGMGPSPSFQREKPSFCLGHRGRSRLPQPRADFPPSLRKAPGAWAPGAPRRWVRAVLSTRAGGLRLQETTPCWQLPPLHTHACTYVCMYTHTHMHMHTYTHAHIRCPRAGGHALAFTPHFSRTGNAFPAHFGSVKLVLPRKQCTQDSP